MDINKNTLYLASKSPRRREILTDSGIRFVVVESSYEEKDLEGMRPHAWVVRHASGKVQNVQKLPQKARWVLGVDTIVYSKGKVVEKPRNLKDAERMLESLQGRDHVVYSGMALLDIKKDRLFTTYDKTTVRMKALTRGEIREYFKSMNPLDKAGAYAIQSEVKVVEKITGSYTNVMGLPMEKFQSWTNEIE